jgi:predicted HAD superfamily hydrolase
MILSVAELLCYNPPPRVKVISFDVFDTLLIRKIDPPPLMKELAAHNAVNQLSLKLSAEDLHARRIAVETELCCTAKMARQDEEYSVSAVYERVCESVPELKGAAEKIVALELETEKAFAAAMPGMEKVLARLSEHYRLIAISDTYLPGSFIETLLNEWKLGNFISRVYASCDYNCNKGSGNLFRRIVSIEGYPTSEWLHIGDNFLSDYFMPRAIGINSVLLRDNINIDRKSRLSVLHGLAKRSAVWKGLEIIEASISSIPPPTLDPAGLKLHDWGVQTLAPPVVLFMHELCIRLMQSPRKGVYFLAREGYMLKRLYEIFNRELYGGSLPKAHYLCISRSTAFLASLGDIGDREIDLVLQDFSVELRDVLRRFGVDDGDIARIAQEHGVVAELSDKGEIRTILVALGKDCRFTSIVEARSEVMRQNLEAYLESVGFFSWDEVALIDVGWYGTIQDSLERYLMLHGSSPGMHGYYLGVDFNKSCSFIHKTGLLHDFRTPTVDGVCLTFFRLAFEFSLRAGHGTTTGYEREDAGFWKPLFRKDQKEFESFRYIRVIQRGVVDFAYSYLNIAKIEKLRPQELRPSFLHFHNMKISFPDRNMIAAFSSVIHTEDYATDKVRHITGSVNLSELFTPIKFFSRLIEIPWRETAIAGLRIPLLLTFFYIFKRILASRRINTYSQFASSEGADKVQNTHEFKLFSLASYYFMLMLQSTFSLSIEVLIRLLDILSPRAAVHLLQRLIIIKAGLFNCFK